MPARLIGHRLFADGATRSIYADEHGKYVEEDGERVYGIWLLEEEDAPFIVPASGPWRGPPCPK